MSARLGLHRQRGADGYLAALQRNWAGIYDIDRAGRKWYARDPRSGAVLIGPARTLAEMTAMILQATGVRP